MTFRRNYSTVDTLRQTVQVGRPGEQGHLFIRVWGFLKYTHPAFTTGQSCPDAAFYAYYPKAPFERPDAAWAEGIGRWLDEIDADVTDVPPRKRGLPKAPGRMLEALLPLGEVSRGLYDRLLAIHSTRSGAQHFVRRSEWGPNADFPHEHPGTENDLWPVLAVARYWTAIDLFFPYQPLLRDWNGALDAATQAALAPGFAQDRYRAALGILIKATRDGHAGLFTDKVTPLVSSGAKCLPFGVRYVEDDLVVIGSATDLATPGERLVAVDGRSIAELRNAYEPLLGSGREATTRLRFTWAVTRGDAGEAKVTLDGAGGLRTVTLPYLERMNRWVWPVRRGDTVQQLGSVAYIQMVFGAEAGLHDFCAGEWRDVSGIIIDLRSYPRFGFETLVPRYAEPDRPFARGLFPELHSPGTFRRTSPIRYANRGEPVSRPTIVLIDEHAASHAEYFAMALGASSQVRLLGAPTAGANGNRSFVPMPNGDLAFFSGLGIYHVDGSMTQGVGIAPDIPCTQRLADTRAGSDSLVAVALRELGETADGP